MTRKREIEIVSERYGAASLMYGKLHNDTLKGLLKHYQKGFVAGVKWADTNPKSPWISVEDDLPYNHEELAHSNYTDRVLVLSRNGYSEVAFMCIIEDVWEWNTLITVLYWMPIPKPPKE